MTKEEVLQKCTIVEGNVVKLPEGQLDRKLYQEVAKALELIGGKWKGGKTFGFVFQIDPTDLLEEIATGEKRNLKKEFQFFETPDDIADYLVELAYLVGDSFDILEPSAGQGAIIKAINRATDNVPDCYELMEVNRIILQNRIAIGAIQCNLVGKDFFELEHGRTKYSRIIANPPFSKNQDIDHVYKMYECLRSSGRIVSVMSESWVTGNQKKQIQFREWLDEKGAMIFETERGAFKESGTLVGARIVVIDK